MKNRKLTKSEWFEIESFVDDHPEGSVAEAVLKTTKWAKDRFLGVDFRGSTSLAILGVICNKKR